MTPVLLRVNHRYGWRHGAGCWHHQSLPAEVDSCTWAMQASEKPHPPQNKLNTRSGKICSCTNLNLARQDAAPRLRPGSHTAAAHSTAATTNGSAAAVQTDSTGVSRRVRSGSAWGGSGSGSGGGGGAARESSWPACLFSQKRHARCKTLRCDNAHLQIICEWCKH